MAGEVRKTGEARVGVVDIRAAVQGLGRGKERVIAWDGVCAVSLAVLFVLLSVVLRAVLCAVLLVLLVP